MKILIPGPSLRNYGFINLDYGVIKRWGWGYGFLTYANRPGRVRSSRGTAACIPDVMWGKRAFAVRSAAGCADAGAAPTNL